MNQNEIENYRVVFRFLYTDLHRLNKTDYVHFLEEPQLKQYDENSLFKVVATKDSLKIEIQLKDLEFLFTESPNNGYAETPVTVKRGQRAAFADFIARHITESEDPDTGENPILQMFEGAFMEIIEGDESFCAYPDN